MPVVTRCPECSRQLRVPDDLLGKKVRCPGCKVVFTAAAAEDDAPGDEAPPPRSSGSRPAPREEPDERIEKEPRSRRAPPVNQEEDFQEDEGGNDFLEDEEAPRGRRRHEDDEEGEPDAPRSGGRKAWRPVATGINFLLISIGVAISGVLLGACIGFVAGMSAAAAAGSRGPGAASTASSGVAFTVSFGVSFLMQLTSQGCQLFGLFKFMSVPDKPGTGLRALAITAFSLLAAAAGLGLVGNIVSFVSGVGGGVSMNPAALMAGGMAGMILGIVGGLCSLSGFVTLVLFLRNVATAVKSKGLAKGFMAFMITAISLVVVLILLTVVAIAVLGVSAFSAPSTPAPGAAPGMPTGVMAGAGLLAGLSCLAIFGGLGMLLWYVILLVQLRGAVAGYARMR